MNDMRVPRIEKITINIGAGKDVNKLDKALVLMKNLTQVDPYKTVTQKRIPSWGLRPGLPVGCKLTLRKMPAEKMLKRLLAAKDKKLNLTNFDNNGNVSFGIHEYIDIPDLKYDPKIGVLGLQVCVTLERPGHRIKRRRLLKKKLPSKQVISREEAVDFMKNNFGVEVQA
ncbi:50S ribosomal protein L5 [Candidatus Woesearchaeota archaeon]|nr:50S ribosomal protein L5 [Candidatus Woesearchaeota archaeon]